jgi:hypothetical protein
MHVCMYEQARGTGTGTREILTGNLSMGYSSCTHRGTHGVLEGYSRGTHRGTHGVLEGGALAVAHVCQRDVDRVHLFCDGRRVHLEHFRVPDREHPSSTPREPLEYPSRTL